MVLRYVSTLNMAQVIARNNVTKQSHGFKSLIIMKKYFSPALVLVFSIVVSGITSLPVAPVERPNILWILAEDMGPELGFLGTPEVLTPNLDRLAGRGMYFTHAFTTSPVCSPSRSAIMTGMYQTTIGAHNHRSHRADDPSPYPFPLPDGVRVVSDWFRHAGYHTANLRQLPDGVDFTGTGKTDWNFTYDGRPFDTDRWTDLKAHQPFYAQINFPETHRGREWDEAHTRIAQPANPDNVLIPPYYPDHPVVREDWAQYLNTVMSLDRKVGIILDLLEQDGLAKNTILVFMGDHGRAMVRGKQWPYDSGLHVPLTLYIPESIPAPARYESGTKSDQLISSIDVTATSLALAGIPKPEAMQGRVFIGPEAEVPRRYVFGGRDRGDETVDRIRTVRSHRFRYVRNFYPERPIMQVNRYKLTSYPPIWVIKKLFAEGKLDPVQAQLMAQSRSQEELYDVIADPYEVNNLAASAEHQEILKQLRTELDHWIEATNDQGRIPEDPAVAAYYEQRMKDNYDERINALQEEWGVK
jgi:arylsulfatase A-like enzyme